MLKTLVHATGVACFGYALYVHPGNNGGTVPDHLASNVVYKAMNAYPGKWKYLTIWDVVLQLVYHSIGLLNDIVGSNETNAKRRTALQKLRDAFFASWAFPIGLFVSSSFWGLYAIDRKLVFPKEVDVFFPSWLNHAVHTAPAILLLLELLTTPKAKPSLKASVKGNLAFTAVYLTWITWVYTHNGVWAYPVLNILNNWQRALFFAGSFMNGVIFCVLGDKLSGWRWGIGNDESSGPIESKPKKAKSPKSTGKGKKKYYSPKKNA